MPYMSNPFPMHQILLASFSLAVEWNTVPTPTSNLLLKYIVHRVLNPSFHLSCSKMLMNCGGGIDFTIYQLTLPILWVFPNVYGIKIMQSCDFIWSPCTTKVLKPGQITAFGRCAYMHICLCFSDS